MAQIPQTLDELIRWLPGIAKSRSMNAATLRMLLDRPQRTCTWCGKQVSGRRLTWCSDACAKAFNLRCSPNHFASYVKDRDKGICQLCGLDTIEAEKDWSTSAVYHSRHRLGWKEYEKLLKAQRGYARGRWREVDHVIPVAAGGGLCPVEQLRLLCGTCHHKVTSKFANSRKRR